MDTSSITSPPTNPRNEQDGHRPSRKWRYLLIGLGTLALTLALFYAEEDWRGKRAWEKCKRELEARGEVLDWAAYIPPPVPDDQNFFAAPKMQEWLTGKGQSNFLSSEGIYSDYLTTNVTLAEVTLTPNGGSSALAPEVVRVRWQEPGAKQRAGELLQEAISPSLDSPIGIPLLGNSLDQIKPVQIILEGAKTPSDKELSDFFASPKEHYRGWSGAGFRVQRAGSNSCRVILEGAQTAADLLARSDRNTGDFETLKQALRRPYARLNDDYGSPLYLWGTVLPQHPGVVPSMVRMRTVSQSLGARAQCHILLGQPEKALDDLTLMHQFRRVVEARPSGKPMPLMSAMINVAVVGLFTSMVENGLRSGTWQEPQLAALEKQLEDINLAPYVVSGLQTARMEGLRMSELMSGTDLGPFSRPGLVHTRYEDWIPLITAQGRMQPLPSSFAVKSSYIPAAVKSLVEKSRKIWKQAGPILQDWLYKVLPRGWYFQNLAAISQLMQRGIDVFDAKRNVLIPHEVDEAARASEATHPSPYTFVLQYSSVKWNRSWRSTARNQACAHQALVACALERYRLARGQYPESLQALTPQFLDKIPRDIIGGQPPHYRRVVGGKFLLYSIGWDEKDHGGVPGKDYFDGDWVWPQDVQ